MKNAGLEGTVITTMLQVAAYANHLVIAVKDIGSLEVILKKIKTEARKSRSRAKRRNN